MDTRSKIVSFENARDIVDWVCGYFDPLLAQHVALLAAKKSGDPLTVQVIDPPAPLLPLRARAELVAALGIVDRVIAGGPPCGEPMDPGVRDEFIARVRERCQ